MRFQQTAAALAASLSFVSAASIRGFNSGSTGDDGSPKTQADFQAEFQNQKNIEGSNGEFNSCRLYTMIQGGTTTDPISAIPAAIAENTGLLLGLWASAGQADFANEIAALQNSIKQYGSQLAAITQGISVGSEDLYRISVTGIANSDGLPGASPDSIADYISQVRKVIAGTALANVPIGHVDTWNAWTNSSNSAAIDASDFIGIDEYPYYQSQDPNPIGNSKTLFYQAIDKVQSAVGSKPIWITETGYPSSGATVGQAVASVANAHQYWLDVYCSLPASTPVYWYIQYQAAGSNTANFGLTGTSLSTTPIFNLSCAAAQNTTTSSSTSSSATSTSSSAAKSTSSVHATTSVSAHRFANTTSTTSHSTSSTTRSAPTSSLIVASSSTPLVVVGVTTTTSVTAPVTTGVRTSGQNTLVTTSATITSSQTPTSSLTPANGASGSSVQIYTLALLIVPAIIAFMM